MRLGRPTSSLIANEKTSLGSSTAPVPVGGALLFVPSDNLLPADLSVDALMSIYVSMGVTAPEFLKTGEKGD